MKLRFRGNSLRLRLNRREVEALAAGRALEEQVVFPSSVLNYRLETTTLAAAHATFAHGIIRVMAPAAEIERWAAQEEIGLYYDLGTTSGPLRIMIEKDLECIDGPPEERDPDAFARPLKTC